MFQLTFSSDSCGFLMHFSPPVSSARKSPGNAFKLAPYRRDHPVCGFATDTAVYFRSLRVNQSLRYMTVHTLELKDPTTHSSVSSLNVLAQVSSQLLIHLRMSKIPCRW